MSTIKQNKTAHNRTSNAYPARFESWNLPTELPITLYPHWTSSTEPIRFLHFHDCLEIGFCRKGKGIILIGEEILPYQTNDVCIIRRHELHFAISDPHDPADWSFIFLDPEKLLNRYIEDFEILKTDLLGKPNLSPLLSHAKHPTISIAVNALIEELRDLRVITKAEGRDTIRALATLMFQQMHRLRVSSIARQSISISQFEQIVPALKHIEGHWCEPIRIPDLALLCSMGTRHFDRCFINVTGKRPMGYLVRFRIAMACTELTSSGNRIISIALDNGFSSISNFNKSFKSLMGISPTQWRAKNMQIVKNL